jgi:hypothetical protein
MKNHKFSIRQAETVARHLRDKGNTKISATTCRWRTAYDVAREYLGSRAGEKQVTALAYELLGVVGVEVKELQ